MKKLKKILIICSMVTVLFIVNSDKAFAAGSFSVSGGGTVAAGGTATVTVSISDGVGGFEITATNGATLSTSYISHLDSQEGGSQTITVTAPSSGSSTITVTAVNAYGYDEVPISGSKTATLTVQSSSSSTSSSSTTTTTTEVDNRSSNNKLSALSVSEGTLSPEFSSGTTTYSVSVTDIETITISATKSDSTASISGTGEKELEAGENTFKIVVTAENGSTKTYTIAVMLKETPTAYAMYGDIELGVVKDLTDVVTPDGFEETTVTVDGEEVTAWTRNLIGMTLLYMEDADGVADFYVYDEATGTLSEYRPLGILGRNVYIVDIPEEEQMREGMIYQLIQVEGEEFMGFAFEDEALSDYFILYVMSDTGEMVNYLYCSSDNAMILAPDMAPISSETYESLVAELSSSTAAVSTFSIANTELESDLETYKYIIIGLAGVALILLIAVIVLTILLAKKSKKHSIVGDDDYIEDGYEDELEAEYEDALNEEYEGVLNEEYEDVSDEAYEEDLEQEYEDAENEELTSEDAEQDQLEDDHEAKEPVSRISKASTYEIFDFD